MITTTTPNQRLCFSVVLLKAIAVMALPVLELILLRFYFHDFLNLRIGFPGFTDYELLLPAPMGFFAFFIALETAQSAKLHFTKLWFGIHCIVISVFVLATQSGVSYGIWIMGLVATILSAFLVFWNPKQILANPNFWAIGPSCVMVFSLVLYMKYGSKLWQLAIHQMEWILREFLSFTGNEVVQVSVTKKELHLYHPLVKLRLGQGCGGFDGIFFFLSALSIFAPLNWRLFRAKTWLLIGFLGTIFFMVLNVLRILVLFSLGIAGSLILGQEKGISLMISIFHAHLGYLLYATGMALFFFTLIRLAEKNREGVKPLVFGTSST